MSLMDLSIQISVIVSLIIFGMEDRLIKGRSRIYFQMLYVFECFYLFFCFFLLALRDVFSKFDLQPCHNFLVPRSSINSNFSLNFPNKFPKLFVLAFLSVFDFISEPYPIISHQFYLNQKSTCARIDQR